MSIYNSDATSSSFFILGNNSQPRSSRSSRGSGRSGKSSRSSNLMNATVVMGSSQIPDVVGLSRLEAINLLLAEGFEYMISYTTASATSQNNDTVASQSTADLIVVLNVYQFVARPVVTGGTLSSDSTYYYRTFKSNGTLSVSQAPVSCDILIVAGGGGAGNGQSGYYDGGAGAGGLQYLSNVSINEGSNLPISIGAGGSGTSGNMGTGYSNGTNTVVGSFTASIGGGHGGSVIPVDGQWRQPFPYNRNGANGGSGGGGCANGVKGLGTPGQGNDGGDSTLTGWDRYHGSGGGAGQTGSSPVNLYFNGYHSAPKGGDGLYYDEFGSATNTGEFINNHYYYAGGGGGRGWETPGSIMGEGGYGGGGGSTRGNGTGLSNTGGGAASGGGNGGSGIVIFRYLKSAVE